MILSDSEVPFTWFSNPSCSLPGAGGMPYSNLLTNKFSAIVRKYNSRYRVFIVNHTTADSSFSLRLDTNEISNRNLTNAYDHCGNLTVLDQDPGAPLYYRLTGTLGGYGYRIYDIGAGN